MSTFNLELVDIGRIGMGAIFALSVVLDLKIWRELFELMQQKNVMFPRLCFIGAECIKGITGLALIFNIYTFWAALLLLLYVFIANLIFNNFWAVPLEQRGFTTGLFLIHLAVCFGLIAVSG